MNPTKITVNVTVNALLARVWACWTEPRHITQWNFAADTWHCPHAENDLRPGGKFSWRMEAKDGSMGFDYSGSYDIVEPPHKIRLTLDDSRKVEIDFSEANGKTEVVERFEAEGQNPVEMQQQGWQMILNNFKRYAENVQ